MATSRRTWGLAGLLAVLPLLGWWLTGLFDLDEGFYGSIAAEMNRRHEWITPFFNGKPWFEKPILIYWLAKPSLAIFGDAFGSRLPSVLATLCLYAVVAWFGERRLGERRGLVAMLILASSLLVVATGRMLLTDPLLNLCLSGALITFWESLKGDRRWRILSALLLGLSALAKGPVGIALFLVILGITYWQQRPLRPAFIGWWAPGICILLLVVASWYVPAYLRNGQLFVHDFLIEQNLQRFQGGDAAHKTPGLGRFVFFIPILLIGMFPWSLWFFRSWLRRPKSTDDREPLRRYLSLWAAVVFVFFSVSGTQLLHYILPVCVPLALLAADYVVTRWKPASVAWSTAAACLIICAVANVGFYYWWHQSGQSEIQGLAAEVAHANGSVAAYQMPRRDKNLGTGKPKLQETSLPSLGMYVHREVHEVENTESILEIPGDVWIFTRAGRIGRKDIEALERTGRKLDEVPTVTPQRNYRLLLLESGHSAP